MRKEKKNLLSMIQRLDFIGYSTIIIAFIWIAVDIFDFLPPLIVGILPKSVLILLGILFIYLYKSIEDILDHTSRKGASFLNDHEEVYSAGIKLIEKSPPKSRIWATALWFYGDSSDEPPGFKQYFEKVKTMLSNDEESQYKRACSATTYDDWLHLKERMIDLNEFPNAKSCFYFENPITLECLLGEDEAILSFPDRETYRHPRIGIKIKNPDFLKNLRDWYQDFIWDANVQKVYVKSNEDISKIEDQKGWNK